ncbi:hypothetical protein V8G56_09330 [Gaetbulibacter aquiaggeris]|uniref:Uncharacterized protein n=1 Tax=Gaetbulibacter aquiaggeris TaxID=1735373 RepID=A0ABW7MQ17_9FLAO
MANNVIDKSTWAIGGGALLGVGIGLAVLKTSVLWFVGSIIGSIGLGLVITAIISSRTK